MADQQAQSSKQLVLQKIYVKDLSFESPKSPEIFTRNAPAQTQLNIRTGNSVIDENSVEVTLTLTVESKDNEETLFLVELTQAGVFAIQGYTPEEHATLLGTFCPGTLYPFAREVIAEVASKGGFPQLLLQPINFDALYVQAQQERAKAAQAQAPAAGQAAAEPAAQPAADGGDADAKPSTPQGNGGAH